MNVGSAQRCRYHRAPERRKETLLKIFTLAAVSCVLAAACVTGASAQTMMHHTMMHHKMSHSAMMDHKMMMIIR